MRDSTMDTFIFLSSGCWLLGERMESQTIPTETAGTLAEEKGAVGLGVYNSVRLEKGEAFLT